MTVTTRPFGAMPDATPVECFTLENASGVSCEVITYGGILLSIKTPDSRGDVDEITLGYGSLEQFLRGGNPAYFGATVGRFANRISSGEFVLEDKRYSLHRNQNSEHHLHGGARGFDKRMWSARTYEGHRTAGVELRYVSGDGEEGYPGELEVTARYELDEEGHLTMVFEARTSAATPVNIVNHAYYNLSGRGSGTALRHELQLRCSRYLVVDSSQMPTGEIADVEGTPLDFRTPRVIGERIDEVRGGYDHCFVVDEIPESPAPMAVLYDPVSRREMRVATTQPGAQFYSGNFLDGVDYAAGDGVCLETQHFPDSPNRPEFPSAILRPGEVYSHTTVHSFAVR